MQADRASSVMTARQVAEYLHVAHSTVLWWIKERGLPAIKLGHQWRVSRRLLDQWLERESSLATEHRVLASTTKAKRAQTWVKRRGRR